MTSLAVFAISRRGANLAQRLRLHLGGDIFVVERFRALIGESAVALGSGELRPALAGAFARYRGLVLIMPLGAAVRLVGPLLQDKWTDPAVVVLDEVGAQAIAMLSGHVGGSNALAHQVAAAIGARPIITTASDLLGFPALDLLGQEWGWVIEDLTGLTRASAALVNGEPVGVYQDAGEEDWWREAPSNLIRYHSLDRLLAATVAARLVISDRVLPLTDVAGALVIFRPKTLSIGIGCVRGVTTDELDELVRKTLADHALALGSVRELATIDRKHDEAGLTALATRYDWPVRYFTAKELAHKLATATTPSVPSQMVLEVMGTPGVCEPAALLAARAEKLTVPKQKTSRATVAVARTGARATPGHLTIVGLGPGAPEDLTERARQALASADTVVGYNSYLDQIRPWLGPKTYHSSPIGDEIERCELAITLARAGHRVALVSSGDAGIYGMAGPVFELLAAAGATIEAAVVEVVPGVSAANAAAALLGAPLMSDYAVISLSDLLTPWETIERRLDAAGAADLVVALYNPASVRRREQLGRAQQILLRYRPSETPVGLVRNASRPGQTVTVTDLGHLLDHPIDMRTVVIIGNGATIRVGDRLVTRRGYRTATELRMAERATTVDEIGRQPSP